MVDIHGSLTVASGDGFETVNIGYDSDLEVLRVFTDCECWRIPLCIQRAFEQLYRDTFNEYDLRGYKKTDTQLSIEIEPWLVESWLEFLGRMPETFTMYVSNRKALVNWEYDHCPI